MNDSPPESSPFIGVAGPVGPGFETLLLRQAKLVMVMRNRWRKFYEPSDAALRLPIPPRLARRITPSPGPSLAK